MRVLSSLIAVAAFGLVATATAQTALGKVDATDVVNHAGRLYVAERTGGIDVFDAKTGTFERTIPTDRRIQTMKVIDGTLCWVLTNSKAVTMLDLSTASVTTSEVSSLQMHGPVQRISGWQGRVVASGETEFAMIDMKTGISSRPQDVLPPEVAKIASQGMVDSFWADGKGIFLSVRRFGRHQSLKQADAIREIGQYTAWTATDRGEMQFLGSYIDSLVDFHTASGPAVEVAKRYETVKLPFGVGDMGNIRLGEEGIVAAGNRESITVPFIKSSWVPNRVATAFWPRYAKTMAYHQDTMWWAEGDRVFTTNLEDGSGQALISTAPMGDIRAIAADDDGAWVATSTGVRRVNLDDLGSDWTSVAASAADLADTHEQYRLLKIVGAQGGGRPMFSADEEIRNLIQRAGGKNPGDIRTAGTVAPEGELGDVVISGSTVGIYMGAGEVLTVGRNGWTRRPLTVDADTQFRRILPRSRPTYADLNPPMPVTPRGTIRRAPTAAPVPVAIPAYNGGTADEREMFPRGLGRAKPSLGHSLFIRCAPGESFDRPTTPAQERLLAIARSWIGTPYRWAGNTKSGVDCSGFVTAVYREMGIELPRHSQDIGRCRRGSVVTDKLHFGDVLVFQSPKHVALYIGNGQTIEAVSGGVGISSVRRRTQAIVRRFM